MHVAMKFEEVVAGADPRTVSAVVIARAKARTDVIRSVQASPDGRTIRIAGKRMGGSGEAVIKLRARGADTVAAVDLTLRIQPPWDLMVKAIDLDEVVGDQVRTLFKDIATDIGGPGREVA